MKENKKGLPWWVQLEIKEEGPNNGSIGDLQVIGDNLHDYLIFKPIDFRWYKMTFKNDSGSDSVSTVKLIIEIDVEDLKEIKDG